MDRAERERQAHRRSEARARGPSGSAKADRALAGLGVDLVIAEPPRPEVERGGRGDPPQHRGVRSPRRCDRGPRPDTRRTSDRSPDRPPRRRRRGGRRSWSSSIDGLWRQGEGQGHRCRRPGSSGRCPCIAVMWLMLLRDASGLTVVPRRSPRWRARSSAAWIRRTRSCVAQAVLAPPDRRRAARRAAGTRPSSRLAGDRSGRRRGRREPACRRGAELGDEADISAVARGRARQPHVVAVRRDVASELGRGRWVPRVTIVGGSRTLR